MTIVTIMTKLIYNELYNKIKYDKMRQIVTNYDKNAFFGRLCDKNDKKYNVYDT